MSQDFLGLTRKHYNAELEAVDFVGSHEAARVNINNWVENQTQGLENVDKSELRWHDCSRMIEKSFVWFLRLLR